MIKYARGATVYDEQWYFTISAIIAFDGKSLGVASFVLYFVPEKKVEKRNDNQL